MRDIGYELGREIAAGFAAGIKRPISKADIRRWSREAKHIGHTPNVAYFAARMPKAPTHKQKVLVRRWRSRGDTWWERFEEAVRDITAVMGQTAHVITTTAGTNLYRFEVSDGR